MAVGWHGGHDGLCESCRRGDFVTCKNAQIPGISYDGGYADYMVAPIESLASIPEQLSAIEAAPLMCAGITTYNALRNSGARPGDIVGVLGMGGLGHLGIQFAAKMGFHTVAIGRSSDKEEELMKKLGARQYIDNRSQNAVEELNKLGGAKVILATVPSGRAMTDIIGGPFSQWKAHHNWRFRRAYSSASVPIDIRSEVINRLASWYVDGFSGYTFV